jgi:hypothetical protein
LQFGTVNRPTMNFHFIASSSKQSGFCVCSGAKILGFSESFNSPNSAKENFYQMSRMWM